jgi:gliding motility-associated-like protein
MKQALAPTVKTSLLAGLLLLLVTTAWAQRPVIQAIERTTGSTGQVVLIKGSSFGTNKNNLRVKFGAAEGLIESATDQTIKVSIPAGTTYTHVTVTNLVSHLSASTQNPFLLSFSGEHPFDAASLDTRQDFSAEKGIEDICLCDLDNDGRSEVIATHKGVNTLSLYRNTSTTGNVVLARVVLATINTSSLHVKCGDLNGDGLQDLVVTEGATVSERIFVIQNSGAFAFTVIPITVPGFQMSDVAISDLDLDGRPDLVVTNQTKTVNNTLAVLRNTTVGTATSFNDAPVILTAPGDAGSTINGTDAIDIQDMNGDGRPEIIAGLLLTTSFNNVYIFANQTTPGTMNFAASVKLPINNGQTNSGMRVGDLDGDGKAEIAYTNNLNSGGVFIFRNTSSGSSFSFTTPLQIPPPSGGWGNTHGIDFGDVDGDGKTDIVIGNSGTAEITVINNNSTPGSYSFTSTKIATILPDKYVRIGDLDGDGKPDIVFPSYHFTTPFLSVLRNKSCVVPKITPDADVVLCAGSDSHTLTATQSPGSYYEWKKGTVTVACGKNLYTHTIATTTGNSGDYTVTIRTEGSASCSAGSCVRASEGVTVTILPAGGSVALDPKSNSATGQVCKNTTITLFANATPSAGLTYTWTGPDGYFETTNANSPPTIVATSVAKAGEYTVVATTTSGCVAGRNSTLVEVIEPPAASFIISGSSPVRRCVGDADFNLELVEAPMAFSYQWFKNGTPIGTGAVSPLISSQTSSNGQYHVVASSTGCGADIPTLPVEVQITTKPVVSFTIAPGSPVCKDQQVTFDGSGSTIAAGVTPVYQWIVDVGAATQRPNAPTANFSYPTTGLKTVRLSIHYGGNACLTLSEQTVQVDPAPAEVLIETTEGVDEFCAGETLTLEVSSTAALKSHLWSTGENTASITVPDGGVYTVDVAFSTGSCVVTKSKTLTQLQAPVVTITATPERINEGETSQLTASGLDTYLWEPAATLSDATVPNPAAQPVTTTEYTVTGVGDNGCPGSGIFILQVVGEAIVNKLNPHNFFSPNNDGPNEQWQVDEILTYSQCGVTIYDDKGVKVFEAKPYHNDWNGTFNGKALPDGVYFYIIRCDGEESSPRAGSITLLR